MSTAIVMPDVGPYKNTATNILGEKWETMLGNSLHIRNELGRPSKHCYYNYPGELYTYGLENPPKEDGVVDAYRGWFGKLPKNSKAMRPKLENDFVSMNRAAVQEGLVTASDCYQFRATHNIQRLRDKTQGSISRRKKTVDIPPNIVFGMPTRPSTPIHTLMEHRYQDKWIRDRYDQWQSERRVSGTVKLQRGQVYETRTSQLRIKKMPVDPAPLWKMPRFTKSAEPHLSTFRAVRTKSATMAHAKDDGINRRGMTDEGTYIEAQTF